jgi:hypothetical protein
MNLKAHFRKACNKRRVHIEQLRLVRKNTTDAATRRKLNNKIAYERRQLETIDHIWRTS